MEISRAQVMIVMAIIGWMISMISGIVPAVMISQDNDRNTVDDQTKHSNEDSLIEGDRDRMDQSVNALPDHQQRKETQ